MATEVSKEGAQEGVGTRAMHWGVMTWVGNAAGCLVGMVPLALPVSIALTVITLLTGIWAMVLGKRATESSEEEQRNASIGFWLGAAHVVIVVLMGVLVVFGMKQGLFKELGILPTE